MNTNSENPKVGKAFQKAVSLMLNTRFGTDFHLEVPMPIGNPPKPHKFDCVSDDKRIAVECKCYTWTETGNVPSAKLGFINEAVFYLSHLPKDKRKIVVIKKSIHAKKQATLAEYYYRRYQHLLDDIEIWEADIETGLLSHIPRYAP